jgi:hypothetical protein
VAEKLLAACTHHLAAQLQAARQAILDQDSLPEPQAEAVVAALFGEPNNKK